MGNEIKIFDIEQKKIFKFSYDDKELTNVTSNLGKQVNSDLERYKKIIDGVFTNRLKDKLQHLEDKIENI